MLRPECSSQGVVACARPAGTGTRVLFVNLNVDVASGHREASVTLPEVGFEAVLATGWSGDGLFALWSAPGHYTIIDYGQRRLCSRKLECPILAAAWLPAGCGGLPGCQAFVILDNTGTLHLFRQLVTGGSFLPSSSTIPGVRLHGDRPCSYWILAAREQRLLVASAAEGGASLEVCELHVSLLTGKVSELRVHSVALSTLNTADGGASICMGEEGDGGEAAAAMAEGGAGRIRIVAGIGSDQLSLATVDLVSGRLLAVYTQNTTDLGGRVLAVTEGGQYAVLDDLSLFQLGPPLPHHHQQQQNGSGDHTPTTLLHPVGSPLSSRPQRLVAAGPVEWEGKGRRCVQVVLRRKCVIVQEDDGTLVRHALAISHEHYPHLLRHLRSQFPHEGDNAVLSDLALASLAASDGVASAPSPSSAETVQILGQLGPTVRKSLLTGLLMRRYAQTPYGPPLRSLWFVCHFWEVVLGCSLNMNATMMALEEADVQAAAKTGFVLPAYGALVELAIQTVPHLRVCLGDGGTANRALAAIRARLHATALFHSRLSAALTLLAALVHCLRSLASQYEQRGHASPLAPYFGELARRLEMALSPLDSELALTWLRSIADGAKQPFEHLFLDDPKDPPLLPSPGATAPHDDDADHVTPPSHLRMGSTPAKLFDQEYCPGCLNRVDVVAGSQCHSGPFPFWRMYWLRCCPCGTIFSK